MRVTLIQSATVMQGVGTLWLHEYRTLMPMGLLLLLVMVLSTTGCAKSTAGQPSSPGVDISSGTQKPPVQSSPSVHISRTPQKHPPVRQNPPIRSKARAPVPTSKPAIPPPAEEQGGRVF
jgi:hypothetical protein